MWALSWMPRLSPNQLAFLFSLPTGARHLRPRQKREACKGSGLGERPKPFRVIVGARRGAVLIKQISRGVPMLFVQFLQCPEKFRIRPVNTRKMVITPSRLPTFPRKTQF